MNTGMVALHAGEGLLYKEQQILVQQRNQTQSRFGQETSHSLACLRMGVSSEYKGLKRKLNLLQIVESTTWYTTKILSCTLVNL